METGLVSIDIWAQILEREPAKRALEFVYHNRSGGNGISSL